MAISKKLILDNGIEYKYHIVGLVEAKYNKYIKVNVLSFISKDLYNKAIEQNTLLREKEIIDKELETLLNTDLEKFLKLQDKSNELFVKINELKPFNDYIIENFEVTIPYKDGFNLAYIESELIKDGIFKNGKIVK